MAMAVAAELQGVATRLFAGEGTGFDLARGSNFDELVATDTMAVEASRPFRELVRESDVVVSVMNSRAAWLADEFKVPCVYVDSLLWMWPEPPPVPMSISRYFVEAFPGVEARMLAWKDILPELQLVSPIIAARCPATDARTALLVNFGGLACSLIDQQALVDYAGVMIECVDKAFRDWPGKVVVAAGQHVLNRLESDSLALFRRDMDFISLSHGDYLAQLDRSRLLISSPGFHAISEAFVRTVPSVFLPSHNLSQTFTLRKLEQSGATRSFDWDRIYGPQHLSAVDEEASCRTIQECVQRFQRDGTARDSLVRHLRVSATEQEISTVTKPQGVFLDRLDGQPGARTIGRYVMELLGVRQRLPFQEASYLTGVSAPV
jgi:hypothetical protein